MQLKDINNLSIKKGVIIDSIPLKNNAQESYSIYLPINYDANLKTPIVFVYDPSGNARQGIRPFIKKSEQYGMIVVCSNNSKNGSYERNFNIAQRLFNEILSIYTIDANQIYLAGFSGGARLATAIATLTPNISGVIACGAGFPQIKEYIPSVPDFLWAGVVGNHDFNYTEMIAAKNHLKNIGFNHALFIYDGGHSWPPEETIDQLFNWMIVTNHTKGKVILTEKQLQYFFDNDYLYIKDLKNSNELIKASLAYEQIITLYNGVYDMNKLTDEWKSFVKSKEYKQQFKESKIIFDQELKIQESFLKKLSKDYLNPSKVDWKWWTKHITALKDNEKTTSTRQDMNQRLLSWIFANSVTKTNPNLFKSTEEQRLFCYKLCRIIYPEWGR